MDIKRQIAQVAFEKAVVDELTDEYKAHDRALKERFLEMTDGMDKAQQYSDVFGELCSLSKVKGKPSEDAVRYDVTDQQAVIDWMDEQRPETDGFAQDNLKAFCMWWFEHTGECPPGFAAIPYKTIAQPPSAKWVTKRDARPKMFEILRDEFGFELDAAMPNLLGDGNDS